MMRRLVDDPELRAALFRFVDVRPACATATRSRATSPSCSPTPRAHHRRAPTLVSHAKRPAALAAATGVEHMAQRFIVGADAGRRARRRSSGCGATASRPPSTCSARRPSPPPRPTATPQRCERRAAHAGASRADLARVDRRRPDPAREPQRQGHRAHAAAAPRRPARASTARATGCATCCAPRKRGRRAPARRHGVDRHARLDHRAASRAARPSRSSATARRPASCCRPTSSTPTSTSTRCWPGHAAPRAHPLTIRLVKGAYWDHEVVEARQHGWAPPVFTERRDCDRQFER